MKNRFLRNTILAAVLSAFVALPFIGSAFSPAADARETTAAEKTAVPSVPAGTYNLDPAHSLIGFAVRHLEINWVEGRFHEFTGTINYSDQDPTKSKVEFTQSLERRYRRCPARQASANGRFLRRRHLSRDEIRQHQDREKRQR